MKMIKLTKEQFDNFAKKSKYANYCQTENYALAMKYNDYEHMYVGYTTNELEILAAGMFLIKKINPILSYAYAPKGFIVDYEDIDLLRKFCRNLIKFLKKQNIIFLKTNPEIKIATIDYKNNYDRKTTSNINLLNEMKKLGFMRRKELTPLELLEPKYNAIINLKDFSTNKLSKDFLDKIQDAESKGFDIEIGDITNIDKIKNIVDINLFDYYKNIYEEFKKNNQADLMLLKINYEKFLILAKKKVENEQEKNDKLNKILQQDPSEKNLNNKMESDKILETYKQDVIHATSGLKNNNDTYIGAAIIIKYKNKISLLLADYNKEYEYLMPKYYLYNRIFNMYKDEYEVADLYGIAGDFKKDSKYEKFNKFKFGFDPIVYEYIGELDIIINKFKHKIYSNNITYSRIITKKD